MSVPHSSTPWSTSGTIIQDSNGNSIIDVRGTNEQSMATAAHIVRCVNADAFLPSDLQELIELAPLNAKEVREAYLLGNKDRDAE